MLAPLSAASASVGKNRWKDVLPDEVTRVRLECADEDWCSTDYINANHIRGAEAAPGTPLPGVPSYIACQAPTIDTVADFWRMIWQQRVPIVVMLTRLTEGSKTKATQYWPQWLGTPTAYGRLIVTLLNEEFLSGNCAAIVRSLRIEPSGGMPPGEAPRVVFHLHYEEWPDFGVPESTRLLRDVLIYLDMLQSHWPQAVAAALSGASIKESINSASASLLTPLYTSPLSASRSSATHSSASSAALSSSSSTPSLGASTLGLSASGSGSPALQRSSSAAVPVPRKPSGSAVASRKTSTGTSSSSAPRKPSSTRVEALTSPRGHTPRSQSGSNLNLSSSANSKTKRHSMHGALSPSPSSSPSLTASSSHSAPLGRAPPDPSLSMSPHPVRPPLARSVPSAAAAHLAVASASTQTTASAKRLTLAQSDPEQPQDKRGLNNSGLNNSGTLYSSPPSSASNSPRTRSRSASQDVGGGVDFGPLVFHCSAGIGRAGTLLAIHISLERLRHGLEVTVAETVHQLRQQRRGMVQNEDQYAFIYRVLADIVNEKQREERMKRRGGADDIRASGMHASGLHNSGLHSSGVHSPPSSHGSGFF